MRTLHVSRRLARHVTLALEGITQEMVADFLPSISLIDLQGQPASSFEKFVAVRGLSGHPVTTVDSSMEAQRERERERLSKIEMERKWLEQRQRVRELVKMQRESERVTEREREMQKEREREYQKRVRELRLGDGEWEWETSWRLGREEWER